MTSKEEIIKKLEYYCSYQERCNSEVVNKLFSLQYPKEFHDEILVHLIQHNFLNEERFAMHYAYSKWNQKKWGKIKIKIALQQKKISSFLIKKSLESIDNELYYKKFIEMAWYCWEMIDEHHEVKRKQKCMQQLSYKGYETELIRSFIENI